MTLDELKIQLSKLLPDSYIYISHSFQGPKGTVIYNIYYNSRLQGIRISRNTILNQTIHRTKVMSNNNLSSVRFSSPILLSEYTRPLRPNSIINIVDLSGIYLSNY